MPTFLTDPSSTSYVLLGTVVVVLGAVAFRRQKRRELIAFGVAAAFLLALFLIDKAYESPREAAVRVVQEMGTATRAKNSDDLFARISESFKYKSLDKKRLRDRARAAEGMGWEGMVAWDLSREEFKQVDETTVEQGFLVQPVKNPQFVRYCVARFKWEADGVWRLQSFALYNPIQRTNGAEEGLPGL